MLDVEDTIQEHIEEKLLELWKVYQETQEARLKGKASLRDELHAQDQYYKLKRLYSQKSEEKKAS